MEKYSKKAYSIKAEKVKKGTELYNYLEDCYYVTDDTKCIKLTGILEEVWPTTIEKLESKYTFEDGTQITTENIPKGEFDILTKREDVVFAERIIQQIQVVTIDGEVLIANRNGIPHGGGDYIVYANKDGEPDMQNFWVVNGMVFNITYEKYKK